MNRYPPTINLRAETSTCEPCQVALTTGYILWVLFLLHIHILHPNQICVKKYFDNETWFQHTLVSNTSPLLKSFQPYIKNWYMSWIIRLIRSQHFTVYMVCVILVILPYGFILQVFLAMSDTSQSDNAAKTDGITYLGNAVLESKALRYIRLRETNSAYAKIIWKGFAKVK